MHEREERLTNVEVHEQTGITAATVKLVSVNRGISRVIGQRHGLAVRSSIGKSPIASDTVYFGREGIAADQQSNRLVHGGAEQAVCAYPADHWQWWQEQLGLNCAEGSFGENLTLLGIKEDDVCVGDRFAWGEVVLEVTKPRSPCANLDLHHDCAGIAQAIARSGRCGWYMRVIREGDASTRDALVYHIRAAGGPTIGEAFAARCDKRTRLALQRRVHEMSQLSSNWRRAITRRLA